MHYSGYDGVRSYSESFPYANASYASQPGAYSASAPGNAYPQPLNQMAFQTPQSRTPLDVQSGPNLNVGATPTPMVTKWEPKVGPSNTPLCVWISALYELMTSNTPTFYLSFAGRKSQAVLTKLSQQGATCQYTVSTTVPDFAMTGHSTSQVPVKLLMESADGDVIDTVDVGTFGYVSVQDYGASQDLARKRKMSEGSPELIQSPVKRSASVMLRPKEEYGNAYGYSTTHNSSSYSPYLQASQSYNNGVAQYSRSIAGYQAQPHRHLNYGYSNASNASPTIKAESPLLGGWNAAYASAGQNLGRHNGVSSAASNRSSLP